MSALVLLLVRRERTWVAIWTLVAGAMAAFLPQAYAATYPSAQARAAAVELARHDGVATALYGVLPGPGTPAQLFAWESGALLSLLVSVMAVLTAIRMTRAAEDAGVVELVRAAGAGPVAPLAGAFAVLLATSALLGSIVALALTPSVGRIEGFDLRGTVTFAGVVALTFLLAAAITAVVAQVTPSAWAARAAGAVMLGVAFTLRALADTHDLRGVNWLTPLGLRATVGPFTDDRVAGLLPAALATVALGVVSAALAARRELGAGMVRLPTVASPRTRIRSLSALLWRLDRATTAWWVTGLSVGAAALVAMGSSVVRSMRTGDIGGGFLHGVLGAGDPLVGYLSYVATVVAILVAGYTLLLVSRAAAQERTGRAELIRTTGVGPWGLTAQQGRSIGRGAAIAVVVTAAAAAGAAALVFSGSAAAGEAAGQLLGRAGGIAVVAGAGIALLGAAPRAIWLAWIGYGMGVTLALLGHLMGLPATLVDLGPFASSGAGGAVARLAVGAAFAAFGIGWSARRDVVIG